MISIIKRVPWHYIIIVIIACIVVPYYNSRSANQKEPINVAQPVVSVNSLSAQTLSRLNGVNSTGPKSYDTGKLSDNK